MAYSNRLDPIPESGTKTLAGTSIASGGSVSVTVAYEREYANPPRVLVSMASAPGGSAFLVPRAVNETATGFTLYVYNTGSSAATWTNLFVNWEARGA